MSNAAGTALGFAIADRVFRLPLDAEPAAPPPAMAPLPNAPEGLRGLILQGGRLLAVWCWDAAPTAWVRLEDGMIGGHAVPLADADAPLLRLPDLPPPPPAQAMPATAVAPRTAPAPPPLAVTLTLGAGRAHLPMAALAGIRPWPDSITPVPGADARLLGYAATTDGPVLVLSPAWCFGTTAAQPPTHLAVLRHEHRLLGFPCRAVAPGEAGEALLPRLTGTPEGQRILALAPRSQPLAPPPPRPHRTLLLCQAGGAPFFLPASEVEAVIPPRRPLPMPAPPDGSAPLLGASAHRGAILPVIDAASRLGSAPLPSEPPMLRLPGTPPLALAVASISGLRAIPEDDIAPIPGDGLIAAMVHAEGRLVPLCRAAALAGQAA